MKRRTQTTYTFNSRAKAARFADWLIKNRMDSDYGYPNLVDMREAGGVDCWCVEHSYESELPRGVAIGIDFGTPDIRLDANGVLWAAKFVAPR